MGEKTELLKKKGLFQVLDIVYLLLIAALTTTCYKLFYHMCTSDTYESDFNWYINLPTSENKERYRLLGWLFDLMYRHGIRVPGMVVYLALVVGCTVLAGYIYLTFFTEKSGINRHVLQALSLCTPFMGAAFIPGFHEYYYRNSFQSYAWHSPTQQSMILYSIFAMMCFIKMYESSDDKVNKKWWILTMLSTLLSAFAKPAFAIDLIPAMIVLFLIDLFNSDEESLSSKLKKRIIMGLSLVPAGAYILLEMSLEFNGNDNMYEGSVIVDIQHVLDYNNLGAAIISGLAFPIVVWAVNIKLVKEKRYKSVFAVFLMGIVQWSLLYEDGERASHGNFTWGRLVGCFLFFMTGIAMAINNWKDGEFLSDNPWVRKAYFMGIGLLFLLHVASQMRYFYLMCNGHGYWF